MSNHTYACTNANKLHRLYACENARLITRMLNIYDINSRAICYSFGR